MSKRGYRPGGSYRSNCHGQSRQLGRVLAVCFVLLLGSSTILAPAMAATPSRSPSAVGDTDERRSGYLGSQTTQSVGVQSAVVLQGTTPRSIYATISGRIDRIGANASASRSHLSRASDRYGSAANHFEDPVTAQLQSFTNAAQGTGALRAYVSTRGVTTLSAVEIQQVEQSSQLATDAANRAARWELRRAQRRLLHHESEIQQGQYRSFQSLVRNANRAFQRSEDIRSRSENESNLRKRLNLRRRAITQYRVGWHQARQINQRLDSLDLSSDWDDRDGDGLPDTVERNLGTNVSHPDSDFDGIPDSEELPAGFPVDSDGDGRLDALDRDSDGDTLLDRFEGASDTDNDGVSDFRDRDDDGDTIDTATEIEDSANLTSDLDFDGDVNWHDQDADGDSVPDADERFEDHDGDGFPAYLDNDGDNDGLPDHYERSTTGTSTASNDSDVPRTAADEAGNGIPDGVEDADNDSLNNFREYSLGTDPFDSDTDGDGLKDAIEVLTPSLSPTDNDTDSDGILDGQEDADNDSVRNIDEVANGSSIVRKDTDRDSLTDQWEIENGSDPAAADPDGDSLEDAAEFTLGTDPTDPDTDDDGVLDGNETYDRSFEENESGVSVVATGKGNVSVDIAHQENYIQDDIVTAGPVVRIHNETAIQNATVKIPIDKSANASDRGNLSIYTWNGSANDRWKPVDTAFENGTAIATVSHFSFFTVIDTDEWKAHSDYARPNESGDPIAFEEQDGFNCDGACNTTNETTLTLGGEPSAEKIVVEQGGKTFAVTPMSNGQRIEEFYDYGNSHINSPLPIARSDTSRLFLWAGPEGLSLVALHDKPYDGSGGAVDMEFSELPLNDGSWVVQDDPGHDFAKGTNTRIPWAWGGVHTDGGVFRGGLPGSNVTITPFFNEEASRSPSGQITKWELLTGQATEPESFNLNMSEPVTVRVPESAGSADSRSATSASGTANWTQAILDDQSEVKLVYQTEQTGQDPQASVQFSDSSGTTVTQDLTIGTVGTVEQQVDVSELSGEVEVTAHAEAVDVRLQVVPGSSQPFQDTDGDGLSDWYERRSWRMSNGQAALYSTDPNDSDTDGDGLLDGEEVEVTHLDDGRTGRGITSSNPTSYDTDGDGLSDGTEVDGWEINITDSPESTDEYREYDRSEEEIPSSVTTSVSVSSSPMVADTDGDGLTDGMEHSRRLTASSEDTDGDTIVDGTELAEQSLPRLFDSKLPEFEGHFDPNNRGTEYDITFSATDLSGVSTITFHENGQDHRTTWGGQESSGFETTFDVDRELNEQFGTVISGLVVSHDLRVTGSDIHGNDFETILVGPNNFGIAAEVIANSDAPDSVQKSGVVLYGLLSGTSDGLYVMGRDLTGMVYRGAYYTRNPGEAPENASRNLRHIANLTRSSEKRSAAFEAMIGQFAHRRSQVNPFEEGSRFRGGFAWAYSGGHTVTYILPIAAEGKVAATASRVPYLAGVVRASVAVRTSIKGRLMGGAIWSAGKMTKAANGLRRVEFRTPGRYTDMELTDRAKAVHGKYADALADTPRPEQRRIQRLVERDSDLAEWIARQTDRPRVDRSVTYLRRTGEPGRRLLSRLDDGARSRLVALREYAGMQRTFVRASARGDMSASEISDALTQYYRLDSNSRRAYRQMIQTTGPKGVDFSTQVDVDDLEIVLDDSPRAIPDGGAGDEIMRSVDDPDAWIDENLGHLDVQEQIRARNFIERNDRNGVTLIEALDEDATRRFVNLRLESGRELRTSLARLHGSGDIESEEINEFAKHVENLEGVDGLESGPIQQIINEESPSGFKGAYREVAVADEIGSDNIRRMNVELPDSSATDGELDILLESGEVVEVKSNWGYDGDDIDDEFEKKLTTVREHDDVSLDGNRIVYRVERVGDPALVDSKIEQWEDTVAAEPKWDNADVNIVVKDESGNVISVD